MHSRWYSITVFLLWFGTMGWLGIKMSMMISVLLMLLLVVGVAVYAATARKPER